MSSWPSPQYSEQRIGNSPAAEATNSIVTGSPPRGTFLFDLEFLDLDAVHAVTGLDDEPDALAFGDFDAGRFEGESLRHDFDRSWFALSEVRGEPRTESKGAEAAAGSCW